MADPYQHSLKRGVGEGGGGGVDRGSRKNNERYRKGEMKYYVTFICSPILHFHLLVMPFYMIFQSAKLLPVHVLTTTYSR